MPKLQHFKNWARELKNHPKALVFLIFLNLVWSVIGIWADWPWLSSVPLALLPFTPICSIYPPLLTIWYILYRHEIKTQQKKIPAWFTTFIFIGCFSYGLLAQIYYPFYMGWIGINFHDVGSMFWVAVYGLQTLIIASELKPIKTYQLFFILGYFAFKDFSDYYYKTFVDFLQPGYPEYIMNLMLVSGIILQTTATLIVLKIAKTSLKIIPASKNPKVVFGTSEQ
jgi:hypothetical protein